MPNVIWTSTSEVKAGRGAETIERALKLRQLMVDSGAVSARYLSSNAGPTAPSNVSAAKFTSMGHMEEVLVKLGEDEWFQREYVAKTNEPSTQIAQAIGIEIE